jgi:hypothetical protein
MDKKTRPASSGPQDERFDMRSLLRLALWGGGAAASLLVAALAAQTEIGGRRLVMAYAAITTPPGQGATAVAAIPARPLDADPQGRRLIDTVSALTADRDRLAARLAVLERGLDDVTGSIGRRREAVDAPLQSEAARGPSFASTISAATQPKPPPGSHPLAQLAPASRVASAHAIARGDAPPADSMGTRTEFGIDLGGAATLAALRELWAKSRAVHARLLAGLRPVMAVREGGGAGTLELRLLAGPLADAGAAARLCAELAAAGAPCRPSVFDGQRLALH